jgi:hypothetical protein
MLLSFVVRRSSDAERLVVVKELGDNEALIDRAVGDEAVRKTQAAWKSEHAK